ncbi:MAG TPA: TonB-dependent receptor, partial [Planctomycetota bacterium]|nr:TonB-dependent receptor [Planctomycetota bacterium]
MDEVAAGGQGFEAVGRGGEAGGPGSYQDFLNTWTVTEETRNAYLQASFEFPLFVPVSGTVGVRYVDTETESSGFNRTQSGTIINFVPGSQTGGYTKTLPSLNLRFEFLPDVLIGRLTASEVLARQAPTQLALKRSLDIVGLTGSRGNPSLQPF